MGELSDLERRAETSGAAAMDLAERRLLGIDCEPDQKAAYELVRRAARLGHEDGRRAWVYLTAAGIGRKADPDGARKMLAELAKEDRFAAVQLGILQHVTCRARLAQITPTVISTDPYLALYPQLFSPAECHYLAVLGTPWLHRSSVLGLDGEARFDEVRDAESCSIPHLAEDLVVQEINRCIAEATGTRWGWGEPLNILKYSPGQQYRPHHDGTGSDNVSVRLLTALIWLNDQFEGGETDFPKINIKVRGGVGDMLVFRNVTLDGNFDERMIHAGLPVTQGVKWMASRWIRGENYLK
ncbi:MAG TPA: 2OG-Fe(II) oxygenase [Sphingomicrobium sp.]|jgi:prolyl 4-hydroxylase|nr:2OG-Fe(II) oxygenase [Sphingomicrobium sp.]HXH53556.1 2OG-Fe(II) oxygenase [Sphingomicrobium sp.]